MTSVISNPNMLPFGNPHLSQVFSKRKRKFKSFNASSIMSGLQYNSDESDYELDEPEYQYYDGAGRPYLDTLIRPLSLFQKHLMNPPSKPEEYIPPLDPNWQPSYTCLATNVTCPSSFVDRFPTWTQAVSEYNKHLEKLAEEEKMKNFVDFNEKKDKELIEQEHRNFMARLPRFSKAYLERMEKEKNKPVAAFASDKFYGRKPTSSSRTAWGHRRNGGGKGKKTERMVAMPGQLSQKYLSKCVRDTKYKSLIVSTDNEAKQMRKVKREHAKEKCKIELEKRQERMREMEKVKIENQNAVKPVEEKEETDYQRYQREQMEMVRRVHVEKIKEQDNLVVPVVKKTFDELRDESVKVENVLSVKSKCNEWSTVKSKITTNKEKMEKQIVDCLYSNRPTTTRGVAMRKMGEMKKGGQFSRLCKSVLTNTKCPHGIRCKFAHNPEQLNVSPCVFGAECRHVSCEAGKWVNKGTRLCSFAHPGEENDRHLFCTRIGMKTNAIKNTQAVNYKPANKINTKVTNPWNVKRPCNPETKNKMVERPRKKTRWGPPKQHVVKVNIHNVTEVSKYIVSNKLENVKVLFE